MDLPSTVEFQLLALVVTERSGRDVAKLFKKETGRTISYGTLYTTFRRLRDRGWVSVRDDEDQDGRIRWFRVSASGSKAMGRAREQYRGLAEFAIGEAGA